MNNETKQNLKALGVTVKGQEYEYDSKNVEFASLDIHQLDLLTEDYSKEVGDVLFNLQMMDRKGAYTKQIASLKKLKNDVDANLAMLKKLSIAKL